VLVLDMIKMGKYKYDTWRILPVKCYIDNFMCLLSCIRNVNNLHDQPVLPPVVPIAGGEGRDVHGWTVGSELEVVGIELGRAPPG
jgi:hypothetical protein